MTVLLLGCGTLSSGTEGTSGLRNTIESVRDADRVAGCAFLREVTAPSSAFMGANDAENMLRSKAASAGGDVLLIKSLEGQTVRGEAYDCATEDEGRDDAPAPDAPPRPSDSSDERTPGADDAVSGLRVVADSSVQSTVRAYVSVAWCGTGRAGEAVYRAHQIYRYENCDEIEETLEIIDVRTVASPVQGDSLSAAFLRYSVGTKVFREVLWLRRVGSRYARTDTRPPTAPKEGWGDEAAAVAREAQKWTEASAVWYE